ncbi:rCG24275 [Rattus norvegicus]|uniref:RCG24275 n=1 Tax=Rattus norvegicus TaxID=10116 RepID=A6KAP7_RAT|nr:rCG24275 [Rattus norvegicus]
METSPHPHHPYILALFCTAVWGRTAHNMWYEMARYSDDLQPFREIWIDRAEILRAGPSWWGAVLTAPLKTFQSALWRSKL